jgi:hypothetical protein
VNRLLGRVTKAVTNPWQMYPAELRFGLGSNTATEGGRLVLAGADLHQFWVGHGDGQRISIPDPYADHDDDVLDDRKIKLSLLQPGSASPTS